MYIYSAGRIASLMINNTSQSDSCVFHLTFFTHIKLRKRTSLYFSLIPTIKTLFSETDVSPVQKNPDWFFKPHIFLPRFVWTSRGGSRIFLGGGALVSCSTSTPINHIVFFFFFLQNISCIRKPQVISEGGAHPLHSPARSAPAFDSDAELCVYRT